MNIDAKKIAIISGPSGVGKSTVVAGVLRECSVPVELSVSATTREPRPGEIHGENYFFLSSEEFESRRNQGDFLEYKEVFQRGFWYGTLKSTVASGLSQGKWVLLEIDVEGAIAVKNDYPDVLMIFLHPGSMETLERRLCNRQSDSQESIDRRLEVAASEMAKADRYDHVIENQNIEQTVNEVCRLIEHRNQHIAVGEN